MKTKSIEDQILKALGNRTLSPEDLARSANMGHYPPVKFKPTPEFSDTVLDMVHQGKLELTMDWKLKKST